MRRLNETERRNDLEFVAPQRKASFVKSTAKKDAFIHVRAKTRRKKWKWRTNLKIVPFVQKPSRDEGNRSRQRHSKRRSQLIANCCSKNLSTGIVTKNTRNEPE
jgi:hypothetical protein